MERDSRIEFIEETHQYIIDSVIDPELVSVTQFVHQFFEKFNEPIVIDKMMVSRNWPYSKYHSMSKEEIISLWDTIRREASEAGTKLHLDIEHFYTLGDGGCINKSVEYNYFLNFHNQYKLECYKAEWRIFDENVKIAGSIDMVFVDPADPDNVLIYDWKRSKEIKFSNKYQSALEPISHIQDCNFWHYALQLNIYKRIIESNYNLKVNHMAIVVFHPVNDDFIKIDIPDLHDEVETMFQFRKCTLESH